MSESPAFDAEAHDPHRDPHHDLADLVSQLEAPKFVRLARYMANLPVDRDELELPAAAYGVGDTELLVRKFGQPGSVHGWAATWVYQQAFLPVGLWDEGSIVAHLKERLTIAWRDLRHHPDYYSILYGEAQQPADGYLPLARDAFYYLATNIAAPLAGEAMDAIALHFREAFGPHITQFGFATPQSMAAAAPDQVRRFAVDLANSPSSYYFVAREGCVQAAPVTEHGLYLSRSSGAAEAATATSLLAIDPPGLADLNAMLRSRATSEADFQAFFTEFPHFLLGLEDGYCEITPHVALASPAGTKLIPDFMVRLEDPSCFALIELKKPTAPLLVHSRDASVVGQSAAKAIKQLLEYTDAVSTNGGRAGLRKAIGWAPYDPSLVVLIGRGSPTKRFHWSSGRSGLPGVQLVTYDFLLERARLSSARNRALQACLSLGPEAGR